MTKFYKLLLLTLLCCMGGASAWAYENHVLYVDGNKAITSPDGYFTVAKSDKDAGTVAAPSIFDTKESYDLSGYIPSGNALRYAIKLESTTTIQFTTDAVSDVWVYAYRRYAQTNGSNYFNLDGVSSGDIGQTVGAGWFAINGVKAGTHVIGRGGAELEIVAVLVTDYCSHTISYNGNIGATNNSTGYLTEFSPFYEVKKGATKGFTFKSYGGTNTWRNWILTATNTAKHPSVGNATGDENWDDSKDAAYVILRGDGVRDLAASGNGTFEFKLTRPDGTTVDAAPYAEPMITDLKDADVSVAASLNKEGTLLTVKAQMKAAASGNIYNLTYTKACTATDQIYLTFSVNEAHITNFSEGSVWRIFEDPATSPLTWNGTHLSTDFKVDTLNGNWKQRGYSYKNLKQLNQEEISINGKAIFPGLYFSGEAGANNDDLGAVELSPKDYRIFLNKTTGANGSITLKNVPAGYYIWVQAYTNVARGENDAFSEGDKLSLAVTTTASSPATRADADVIYQDNTHQVVTSEVKMLDKHMFCYKVWEDGDYTIAPAASGHACYIYYVAVSSCPITLLSFDNFAYTTLGNEDTYRTLASTRLKKYATVGQSFTPPTLQTRSDNVAGRSITGDIVYTSDDPTVATVNPKTGAVTVVGPGIVTITATLKEGTSITVSNSSGTNTYVNPYDLSASYTIEATQSGLGKYQIAEGTFPALWGMTTSTIDAVKESLAKNFDSQYHSSILQIYGLPKDISKMTDYSVIESTNQVPMYYGSWKYWQRTGTLNFKDGVTYHYYNDDGDGGTVGLVKDVWEPAKTYTVGNETAKDYQSVPLDGFDLYTAHKSQNAKGEFLYTNKNTTKNSDGTANAEYKTAANYDYAHDKGGTVTPVNGVGNPYTVPCFGDYVKFEPTKSGTITAYVLQNGTINFDANNNHLTNGVSWRPLYIVDEAGKRLDGVKAVTKQKVLVSPYDTTIDVYKDGESDNSKYLTDANGNPATYQSFVEAAKALHPQFGNTYKVDGKDVSFWPERGEVEQVWGPDVTGDGWVIISKAYVKYQFPVKAGKTYYLFMNNSKVGICGYTFLPGSDYNNAAVTISENDNVAATARENVKVTLEHSFHTGWNSICLPFSMTESKVREWFGTDDTETHELVTYNGADYPYAGNDEVMRANFFHHVWQDIIAGMPYMLYIPEGAKALTQNVVVDHVTIEGVEPNATTYSKEYMPKESKYHDSYNEGWFTYKGIYTGENMPIGSYLVSTQGLYLLNGEIYSPGYRAYITPPVAAGARKRTLANFEFENILEDEQWSNDATVINDIAAEWGIIPAPTAVYNLQGQIVRQNTTTLEGLPQGIYIVNGKKYLVQ